MRVNVHLPKDALVNSVPVLELAVQGQESCELLEIRIHGKAPGLAKRHGWKHSYFVLVRAPEWVQIRTSPDRVFGTVLMIQGNRRFSPPDFLPGVTVLDVRGIA
jgi:hypothetical protein